MIWSQATRSLAGRGHHLTASIELWSTRTQRHASRGLWSAATTTRQINRGSAIQQLSLHRNSLASRHNSRVGGQAWRWIETAAPQAEAEVATTKALINSGSTPPLAVRTALVATTTAIGTPAFPVVGAVNFGLRYLVWDTEIRHAVLGVTTLLGGIGTLLSVAANDLLPLAYSYGQLFLPFAVVNGGLAGTAYLALDVSLGTARIASLPWTGAAIGGFIGFVGPMSGLYDSAFQWFYDIPEADGWFKYLLTNSIMLPISVTTAAAVGACMHPLLYFPIVGIPGVHWSKFSGPLLLGATALMTNLYMGDYFDSSLFPEETYCTASESMGLTLVPRFQAKTLQVREWGPGGIGYQPLGTGKKARESVQKKLDLTKQGHNRRTDMVFDSRRKAWLHYVTNGAFGSESAIKAIWSPREISEKGRRLLLGDGAVAFIMVQGGRIHKTPNNAARELQEQLTLLAKDLQTALPRRAIRRPAKELVDRIELASHGISLLFTRRKHKDANDSTTREDRELKIMEHNIRNLVPGIILYKEDEDAGTEGCSVESQLEELGWDGLHNSELGSHVSRRWNIGINAFLTAEEARANARNLTWAITGLSMVILFGLFGGGGG